LTGTICCGKEKKKERKRKEKSSLKSTLPTKVKLDFRN